MKNERHNIVWLFNCFLALLMIAGCDNTIDGFDEEGGVGGFSVYGALDYSKDVHFIRVQDLSAPLLADSVAELDVEVSLTNVDAGITETLPDSVIVFDDIATHNFRTTMDITPQTTYRLKVEDDEGFTQNFEAITPADAEVTVTPTDGYTCNTVIRITFDPVQSNELVQGEFLFSFRGAGITVEADVQQNNGMARIVFEPRDVVSEGIGDAFECGLDVSAFVLKYTHIGPGFEEILNDFEGLGTEQFVGLFQDNITFSFSQSQ